MIFDIGRFSTFYLIYLIGHKGISGICRILQILDFIWIGLKSIFHGFGQYQINWVCVVLENFSMGCEHQTN